ncbi:hypothetical protein [Geofilum rubicundum]|uniref:Predicted rhamnogalacturonan lyase in rhamnose utilization cluster n=1 Tax=Geofilum rubicundum JCM 15548 TaxID=1236989 RepID=A0A0E9LV56_9BACT|nr:hypothetical protein [Geofilum rubicundum]GAO29452.1 predicted rhamnogalacturonan lyase in rhamnose utilization cluster [Geofilum rubicundum JCM 15548]
MKKLSTLILTLLLQWMLVVPVMAQRPMEFLDRGLVAMETNNGIFLTWRMVGTDPADVGFNLYRDGEKINSSPITSKTNYRDAAGSVASMYTVETIVENGDNEWSAESEVWPLYPPVANPGKDYVPLKRIPLPPAPVRDGVAYTPGDMSVGDLTGDGRYELVFEWESNSGTHSCMDAIDLDGNHLWRVQGGPNVSTAKLNILVYDLNMDGRAEVAILSGPGTIDGKGNYLSKGVAADYDPEMVIPRPSGRLMEDPQFITVFDGLTGEEMATTEHWPPLGPVSQHDATWGDNYGHRASSLKGGVIYTLEHGPLLVYQRGVYTRVGLAAHKWDVEDGLEMVWSFDSYAAGNSAYSAQGNHSVVVGDLDGDGNDEYIYGAAAINHDGSGLYSTGFGHGDSHALADHDPYVDGLEYFQTHENNVYGISMRKAGTGEILWQVDNPGDIGRGWAADVDPRYPGSEAVGIGLGNFNKSGFVMSTDYNAYDQPLYFDGDIQKDLRNGGNINGGYSGGRHLTSWYYGASTIHSTKSDANLVADIIGDWREEVIFRENSNEAFLIFSSWFPTERKNYTLMHDPVYRMTVAVQNVGYNQPAHVGYYFPDGAPVPDIEIVKYAGSGTGFANADGQKPGG